MKTNTVKGTRDYLPKESELREFIQRRILETYRDAGFVQVITPILEDIDNLNNSEGGDNLSLIFEVLKRGNKLSAALNNQQFDSLSDMGLRYELTLSLCRYYANNKSKLIFPMKCIQIGNVYRAENPQRGRYRELIQCDIDIIGLESYWAEVELITTIAEALTNLGLSDFRVRLNDRRILKDLFRLFGFEDDQLSSLCVTFDKMEKIGVSGIERELSEKAFEKTACQRMLEFINENDFTLEKCVRLVGASSNTDTIQKIAKEVNQISKDQYRCDFDITLVRGQGYYIGPVFEVESLAYSSALAGGGRYDNSIGKFTNEKVPAVGFSIGFERVFDLLLEQNYTIPNNKQRVAVFFEEKYMDAHILAGNLRKEYSVSVFEKPQKLGKFLNKLQDDGYVGFCIVPQSQEITMFQR